MSDDSDLPRKKLEAIRKFNFKYWNSYKPNTFRDLIIYGWPNTYDSILDERSAKNLTNFYKYIYEKNKADELTDEDKHKLYQFFHTLEEEAQKTDDIDYDGEKLHNIYFVNLFDYHRRAEGIKRRRKKRSSKLRHKTTKRKTRRRKTRRRK